MVALNTAYAAPKNAADPKNRVGDFFYEDSASVGKNRWVKCLNAQEKSSYHYETASGRSNWPNRDPIGEYGGLNLFAMVLNNSIGGYDLLGLSSNCCGGEPLKSGYVCCSDEQFRKKRKYQCCDGGYNSNKQCACINNGGRWIERRECGSNRCNSDGEVDPITIGGTVGGAIGTGLGGLGGALAGGLVGAALGEAYCKQLICCHDE
jgi:hypothetical protein